MQISLYHKTLLSVLLIFFCLKSKGQNIGGIDSVIKKWELQGIPKEHTHDYTEYINYISKRRYTNSSIFSNSTNKQNNITATNLCYNSGFELSDFSNWARIKGTTGLKGVIIPVTFYNLSTANYIGSSNIVNNASIFTNDLFVLNSLLPSDSLTGVGYDYYSYNGSKYTFKPLISTGGNYSTRFGNANPSLKANKIEYTFKVTSNEPLLIYNYAFVFSDGSHLDGEQAAFSIRITDSLGNAINFPKLPYVANVNNAINNPNFSKSFYKADTTYDVYYKTWTTDTLNLCNYVGRTFKLVYEAIDCIYGAHFCYAYVDAKCVSINTGIQPISCYDSLNYGFVAPSGFPAYQWIDSHGHVLTPAQTGNQPFLNIPLYLQNCATGNCNADPGSVFTLKLTTDFGCVITTSCIVQNSAVHISSISKNNTCNGGSIGSINVTPSGGLNIGVYNYVWYANSCIGSPISTINPISNLLAGDYCVHISYGLCPPKDSIIHISELPLIVKNQTKTIPLCIDSTFMVHTISGGSNYTWYKNNTILLGSNNDSLKINPIPINNIYSVAYVSSNGCNDSIQYRLTIGKDTTFKVVSCPNDSIALLISPHSINPESYQWYDSNNAVLGINGGNNDSLIIPSNLVGQLYVIFNINDCNRIAKSYVRKFPEKIFLPNETTNVFTPNNDGVNDIYFPCVDVNYSSKEIDLEEHWYELNIYNRWGTLVFKSNEYTVGWDGKTLNSTPADDGTYFWIASYISNCSSKNEKIIKKGFVQLFR